MDPRLESFQRLLDIMDRLRAECPWDKKQTFESLRHLTIEETYELSEAILEEDPESVRKELGDLIMHLVFYSKIAEEKGEFSITEVLNGICEKLIFRHPHVFGDVTVKDEYDVKNNWEALKIKEGNKTVLGGVPKSLPAMVKSFRIQDKARSAGFDWDQREQVWDKVNEEIYELKQEIAKQDTEKTEAEFGDVFFSLINAARLYKIDPEAALERTNKKFIFRFNYLEATANAAGKSLQSMSLEEMESIWQESKKTEINSISDTTDAKH